MKKLITAAALALAFSVNANASVVNFSDGGASLQSVLDGITTSGSSSVNVATDGLADAMDSSWTIGGTGGSVSTVVIELAGFASSNTFGIYDLTDKNNSVELFGGSAIAGAQSLLSIQLDGSVFVNSADSGVDLGSLGNFGYYLGVAATGSTYYSDTNLNADGEDHMAAYQGTGDQVQVGSWAAGPWGANEYVLAWEDLALAANGSGDYDDFVVMVESVSPVPEPASLALLGLGLAGLGFARRAKKA